MSEIRLDRAAYLHNLAQICKKSGGVKNVILVLKDNAYGHGAALAAKAASEFGIEFCAVKNEREAREIGHFFKRVLILSHIANGDESDEFIYAANCLRDLERMKEGAKIHLAVDTLMHRNGVLMSEIEAALALIKSRNLRLLGAYTHFRASDELSADYFAQRRNFVAAKDKISKFCESEGLARPIFHSHNSAGLERVERLDGEFSRVGMAQYGYAQFDESLALRPVMSLWARRVSSRELKAGQGVGYGAKFVAPKDMRAATYDVGYGDGLPRYAGEGELRTACGLPLLGKMSMDSFSCEDAGEEICVFDDARVWSKFFGTIEYDVLVKLSPFIKRVWR